MFRLVQLECNHDQRGSLTAIEYTKEIDFLIRRVFFIYGNENCMDRAGHANSVQREALVAINGSCDAVLTDGISEHIISLDSPEKLLLVEPATWIDLTRFSQNTVLLVLSDGLYDPALQMHDFVEYKSARFKESVGHDSV